MDRKNAVYDPNRGTPSTPKELMIDGYSLVALTDAYKDWLQEGIEDDPHTQMVFLNNRGLLNPKEVKEYLDEQSNTNREINERPRD